LTRKISGLVSIAEKFRAIAHRIVFDLLKDNYSYEVF